VPDFTARHTSLYGSVSWSVRDSNPKASASAFFAASTGVDRHAPPNAMTACL